MGGACPCDVMARRAAVTFNWWRAPGASGVFDQGDLSTLRRDHRGRVRLSLMETTFKKYI